MRSIKSYFLLAMVCLFGVIAGVSAQENTTGIEKEKYEASLAAFNALKEKHENNYSFTLSFASVFGGYSKTTMVVRGGKVVERHYERGHYYDKKKKPTKWVEKGDKVGSHSEGEKPITLETVYGRVASNVAQSPAPAVDSTKAPKEFFEMKVYYYFDTDKNGVVATIGTVMAGCMDDCFRGYRVSDVKWGKNSSK